MKRRTLKEFIEIANNVHNYKFLYTKSKYVDSYTKLVIICAEHGEWEQLPVNHLSGHGCPKCKAVNTGNVRRSNTKVFIDKSIKIHGSLYDYSVVEYANSKTKVIINCLQHGKFYQSPSSHLQGHGCPICGNGISKGEGIITEILTENVIRFVPQKEFPKLRGKKKKLQCDFWIPKYKIIIEYDGIQHFKPYRFTSNKEKSIQKFNDLKICDNRKNQFAQDNNLQIIRVPYYKKTRKDILAFINKHSILNMI